MRRNIRVKELHTPCAGHRPGAADPKRSKAAYPPPRLGRKGEEIADMSMNINQKSINKT